MENITDWYEGLNQPHTGQRVIIALLPDAEAMSFCAEQNRILNEHSQGQIVFAKKGNAGATSVAHMSIMHMDCDRVGELVETLDVYLQPHITGLKSPPIELEFSLIQRHQDTPFIFWDADLPSACLNGQLARLVMPLFIGRMRGQGMVKPLLCFATPGSLDKVDGLTKAQARLQREVGYSHAGLWHMTLGLKDNNIPIHTILRGKCERTVLFRRLVLGYCGPNGTIARVIKSWEV